MNEREFEYDSLLRNARKIVKEKAPDSFSSVCSLCRRTIKADEGRFTCIFCRSQMCEKCGKRMKWEKNKSRRQQCPIDGSKEAVEWVEKAEKKTGCKQ